MYIVSFIELEANSESQKTSLTFSSKEPGTAVEIRVQCEIEQRGLSAMDDSDRITEEDRRTDAGDSYKGNERRKMKHGVLYTCYGAIAEVEDWLDDQCEGDFHLVIEEIDDDLVRKSLKIMFEKETDKSVFVEQFAK